MYRPYNLNLVQPFCAPPPIALIDDDRTARALAAQNAHNRQARLCPSSGWRLPDRATGKGHDANLKTALIRAAARTAACSVNSRCHRAICPKHDDWWPQHSSRRLLVDGW